jgi:hypothetical protein
MRWFILIGDSRHIKILKISQAHLLPGMSLYKWGIIILNKYCIRNLDTLSDKSLDQILQDIENAKNIQNESDLYVLREAHPHGMVLHAGNDTRLLPGLPG